MTHVALYKAEVGFEAHSKLGTIEQPSSKPQEPFVWSSSGSHAKHVTGTA